MRSRRPALPRSSIQKARGSDKRWPRSRHRSRCRWRRSRGTTLPHPPLEGEGRRKCEAPEPGRGESCVRRVTPPRRSLRSRRPSPSSGGSALSLRCYLPSLTCFSCASPFSTSGPSVCSMLVNRHIALPMKFCLPNMLQITLVCPPASENTKSELLEPSNGRVKSVRVAMRTFGLLSVIVIVPAPTLSLLSHVNVAPGPACGPENVTFAFGSSFAQGDQSSHFLRIVDLREHARRRRCHHGRAREPIVIGLEPDHDQECRDQQHDADQKSFQEAHVFPRGIRPSKIGVNALSPGNPRPSRGSFPMDARSSPRTTKAAQCLTLPHKLLPAPKMPATLFL